MPVHKMQYLQMLQSVILRMAQNSFALKGWSVTLVTGLTALSFVGNNEYVFLLSTLLVFIFWFLDSYYLQQERKYRDLYNRAVIDSDESNLFNFTSPIPNKMAKTYFYQSLFSRTEAGMYIPFSLALLFIWLFSCFA
jgi:hypothetical protein